MDSVPFPPAEAQVLRLSNCDLAQQLLDSYKAEGVNCQPGRALPSPPEVAAILQLVRELLLPGSTGLPQPSCTVLHSFVEGRLAELRVKLVQQLFRGLHYRCSAKPAECAPCESRAAELTGLFMNNLTELRRQILRDVAAAYDGDPAATGLDEVVFSYPGIRATTMYRIAHALWQLGAAVVPRMMTELAHAETGIDIHPGARIGERFFIDHGTGVVIGETTVIGHRVRLYQGVTLGALSLPTGTARQKQGRKRHPTIEDEVIIYANATILGGDTVIGRGAVIGGNSFVTESIPPGARVANACR
jgi:serine O-acetyltransferase